MLLYLWFRFEWQYGIGAIASLVHDVSATIGIYALSGIEFNLTSVAAVLTIVGYSLNDTVVIYDRVRENLRRYKAHAARRAARPQHQRDAGADHDDLAHHAAWPSSPLWLFGGEVIRGFTIIMIWGVVIGTYSTIYIATPVLYYLNLRTAADKEPSRRQPSRRADGRPLEAQKPQFAPGLQLVQAYRAGGFTVGGDAVTTARSWSCPTGRCPGRSRRPRRSTSGLRSRCARSQPAPEILVVGTGAEFALLPAGAAPGGARLGPVVEAMATPPPAAPTTCCWPRTAASPRP